MSENTVAKRRSSSPVTWLLVLLLVLGLILSIVLLDPAGRLRSAVLGGDRDVTSGATLVEEIREVSTFTAATGTYSVPVYVTKDQASGIASLIPDILDGEQIMAMYTATINASVDLSALADDNVATNPDGSVTVTVPEPTLSDPNIDEEKSRVMVHSRGVLTRIGDAVDSSPLTIMDELDNEAIRVLSDAAEQSALEQTARDNTESFLESLIGSLGHDDVDVVFRS